MMNIAFFLCENDYRKVKDLTRIEDFVLHHPQLVWIWTTYFRLKQKGHPVTLSCQLPAEGIVVISTVNLNLLQRPPSGVFFITTLADSPPPFFAQLCVSQNPLQAADYRGLGKFPVWRFIPHWPQPGIVPRLPSRADKFERLVFMGHRDQIAPYFDSVECGRSLAELGVTLDISEHQFHDYSGYDAAIAVRDFTGERRYNKPFTKLVNGWQAGVPVIVGRESSFEAVQTNPLDFLAVQNEKEFLQALQKLKCEPNLRAAMVKNGLRRTEEFSEAVVIKQWEQLLFADAQALYAVWMKKSRISKELQYTAAFISRSVRSLMKRLRK